MQRALLLTSLILGVPGMVFAQGEPVQEPMTEPAPVTEPMAEPGPVEPAPMQPEPEPMEPEPALVAPEPAVSSPFGGTVGYKKGFFIQSADEKFKLAIQGRVQGRFELSNEKDDADDRATSSAFSIPRARLSLKGHLFSKDLKFKFQTDFGKGFASLKDFYVDYKLGTPVLRFGQFKKPFSRQQLGSTTSTLFVERALTDKAFGAGRDIGIQLSNNYEKSPEIEWAVGLFNGTGDKAVLDVEVDPMTGGVDGGFSNVPADFQPAFVARGGYNHGGIKGYNEADFEGGPMRFAVGGSLITAFDNDNDDNSAITGQVDAMIKNNGLTATTGVYVQSAQDGDGFADQSYSAVGFHLDAGYLIEKKMQPAIRYSIVAPDGEDATHEIAAAFTLFKFKHGFKWQTDVGLVGPTSGIADEFRLRTQLQLAF